MIVLLAVLYWLLPIQGQLLFVPGGPAPSIAWPRFDVEPSAPRAGGMATLTVIDVLPWANVATTVDGRYVPLEPDGEIGRGLYRWRAAYRVPASESYAIGFYYDCHIGCAERATFRLGAPAAPRREAPPQPTKLGLVFAAPERDWHGRAGWDVELLYCTAEDERRFGLHGLAEVVGRATERGLRVLVRIAYDRQQSLPPADDQVALARYLACVDRVGRDARLRDVYGYVVGSGFNGRAENARAADRPTTARWYARVFNGFGLPANRTDNVVQRLRAANPNARVLVGPVAPVADQVGEVTVPGRAAWLDYMASVVDGVATAAGEKARAGFAGAGPDGFAVQAQGAIDGPGGFGTFRDAMAVVNADERTRGRPLFITAANTFGPDGAPPAQNYPAGWLRRAAAIVNEEPQVQALAWFVDDALDDGAWEFFSLDRRSGRMADAADELDALLAGRQ